MISSGSSMSPVMRRLTVVRAMSGMLPILAWLPISAKYFAASCFAASWAMEALQNGPRRKSHDLSLTTNCRMGSGIRLA